MTSASFGTIEKYYARTLPIVSDISRTNGRIRTNFILYDQNFISDPVIAKYLISNRRFPEHLINELPYRAILFGFYLAILLNLCVI